MRKKILAANWKMNLTQSEAGAYLTAFLSEIGDVNDVEVVFIPPFTAIPTLAEAFGKHQFLRLGAQNMHWEKGGAFTGEISAQMLRALYVKYVVIGHSERRTLFGETDETVNRKVRAALDAGLRPIICVGESLRERESNEFEKVLDRQLHKGLENVAAKDFHELVIAYEPIWAIGTGRTASPEQAQQAHAFIRSVLSSLVEPQIASKIRIQYGGSVKPENTEILMRQPDIDGALVGGASLDPRSFSQIVKNAELALNR
jgi:triosephosphate isomerase (TIM)